MSLLGSAFGRGLAGAGRGVSDLASKYIDQELMQQRAQFMADLQLQGQVKLDEYQQSDARQARLRENERQATISRGEATAQAQRDSVTAANQDTEYQSALDEQVSRDSRRKIDARKQELRELSPLEREEAVRKEDALGAVRNKFGIALAEAQGRIRHKWDQRSEASVLGRIDALEKSLGRSLSEDEKLTIFGLKRPEKGEDPVAKLALDATKKALENGEIKPEDAGAHTNKVMRSFQEVKASAEFANVVAEARKNGKVPELLEELRQKGVGADRIGSFFSPDELKALGNQKAGGQQAPGAATQAAAGAAAQAAKGPQTLEELFNAHSGTGSVLRQMGAEKASQAEAAGRALKEAQDQMAAAAKSQDPVAATSYAQRLQAARNEWIRATASLSPHERAQAQKLLGL